MDKHDKKNSDIVYIGDEAFSREEHERILKQFFPPEGEDFYGAEKTSKTTTDEIPKKK